MIVLDPSDRSIVVLCDECPSFVDIAVSREAARGIGADHEERAHPEQRQARDTLGKLISRTR